MEEPITQTTPTEEPAESEQPVFAPSTNQSTISRAIQKVRSFYIECRRVIRITKKPESAEFKTILKVSSLGLVIIGIIGFLLHILKELLFR